MGLRRGGAQAEAAGAACYDGDLAFEGEEGGEILELCFGHDDDWKGGLVGLKWMVCVERRDCPTESRFERGNKFNSGIGALDDEDIYGEKALVSAAE